MNWELRVLGPLELLRDGESVPLDGAAGWILGRLAVEPGRLVAVPDLMNALWGDDLPSGPAKAIQSYVSRLRAVTGPDLVVTRRPGYLLAIEPDVVDAVRFAQMVANGRTAAEAGAHVAAVGRLDLAEQQWRGEAFSDLPDLPYVRQERTRLRDLRVTARELAVGARLAGGEAPGDSQPIVAELEALLSVHPLREQLWAYLVQAHYRAGRQAEALAAYQRARAVLISELGMEPGPLLREAELAVLRQEPLEPQAPPPTLPAELVTQNAMPLVGRDTILAALHGLLDEAAFGEPQGALLCGAPGSGKTRLLAEFARVAADRGAAIGWLRPGEHAGFFGSIDRYTVYLLDDADRLGEAYAAQLAKRWRELRGPVILVATAAEPVPLGLQQLDMPPLTAADVTAVVRQYAPHEPAEEVDRFAEGLATPTFAVVHERAAAWAVERAVTQVGAGVANLTVPADQARQARAQLLAGVSDLIRLRQARAGGLKSTNDCPYPGLGRFETDDAAYFHGRDRAIADLITRVAATEPGGVIAVVGPSGSGKSSLVRAGLLAALADGVLPGSADWRVQVHEPSRSTPDGPADLVVIDQFEEVFTVLGPAARARYTEKMAATARIVITLRSDYLATVSEDIVYGPMMAGNPVLMAQPSRAELADMIYGPAAACGLEIEPGLVDDIVADLGAQRHLPLLCTALAGLWRARQGTTLTRDALREQGGIAGAVERLGESAYAAMDLEQQQAAHRMLLRLTDVDPESGPIRRPEHRDDLLDVGAAGAPEALEILVTHRLVVADGERVEIAHEALLRHWPRLSDWLQADAAGRQLRQQMIEASDRWRGGGEPADLYRGARLAAAREWAADHGDELTPAEHEFLATSITHAERGQRRLRLLTGVVAAGLVMAIVAGIVAAVQWRRADTQRDRADAAALSAETRRLSALALTERNLRLSMLKAVAAVRLDQSTATSYGLLAALQRANALISVRGNESGDPQRAMALSGDGSLLAVGSRNARVEVYLDRKLTKAWNAEGLMPIHGMQFLNGDRELAVWSDQAVRLYDPRTGDPLGPARPKPKGITAGVLADGHTMVLAGLDEFLDGTQQPLRLWDMSTSRAAREAAPAGRWTSVSSDQTLAGPSGIGIIENGRVRVLRDTPSTVAARSPAGKGRMAAAAGATLTVWGTTSATSARRATAAGPITNLAYAADGQRIITAGDGQMSVWDVATLTPVMTATVPGGGISGVALAPDGRYAYASGADGGIYTWLVDDPLTGGQPLTVAQTLPTAGCDSTRSNVHPLAESLAIACDAVSFVDYQSGAVTTTSLPSQPTAYGVGGGRLLAGLADGTVRELSPESRVLATAGVPVASVAAHGDLLAYAGGGTVYLVQGGKPLLHEISQEDDPKALAFSPDGRYLALGQYAQAQVLELPSGRPVATLSQAGAGWQDLLSFSGDGRQLLVGGESGRVQLIDTTGWRRLWEATSGHAGFTVSAGFGGDGRSVITSGDDGRILVLDRETGAVLARFGPGGHILIAATVRGPDIVAVIDFTRLRSYHIDPAAWIERACVVAGRDMTAEEWASLLPGKPRIAVCP